MSATRLAALLAESPRAFNEHRAAKAEAALMGKPLNEATAAAAGVAATDGARPLAKNAYKVPLTQAVVKRAVLSLA